MIKFSLKLILVAILFVQLAFWACIFGKQTTALPADLITKKSSENNILNDRITSTPPTWKNFLSIVVPLRNRVAQAQFFTEFMVDFLPKHLNETKFEINLVWQEDTKLFNRAKLMNVGIKESSPDVDYFIFHDVDLIPSPFVDYHYPPHEVEHMSWDIVGNY
jgi:hypothetical protein